MGETGPENRVDHNATKITERCLRAFSCPWAEDDVDVVATPPRHDDPLPGAMQPPGPRNMGGLRSSTSTTGFGRKARDALTPRMIPAATPWPVRISGEQTLQAPGRSPPRRSGSSTGRLCSVWDHRATGREARLTNGSATINDGQSTAPPHWARNGHQDLIAALSAK